jgi:acyl-CoA reductase-like NAD-dependent aldehyde dehydrogenase
MSPFTPASLDDVARAVAAARLAQSTWAATPITDRLQVLSRFRALVAEHGDLLAAALNLPQRRSAGESWTSEIVPLADACRFLEREAGRLLSPHKVGATGRPLWLWGSTAKVQREPWGVVLVVGPANYPLLLPGVQTLQALAAGNAVALKPGRGGGPVMQAFRRMLVESGLDGRLLTVLAESSAAAQQAIEVGVDKVLLTGSATAGRAVLGALAERLVPATLELSGCDAMFLLPGVDLDLAVRALAFGLTLNSGQTCIAPRRVFGDRRTLAELCPLLAQRLATEPPVELDVVHAESLQRLVERTIENGAHRVAGGFVDQFRMTPLVLMGVRPDSELARTDVFAPLTMLIECADAAGMLAANERCPYALGASVFGPAQEARAFADRVPAGVIVVNDLIVPTADPRLPFGGRGESGYGVTRGAEGLLELTRPKVIIHRRGRFRPHFEPASNEVELAQAYLQAQHGAGWRLRLAGWRRLIRSLMSSDGQAKLRERSS